VPMALQRLKFLAVYFGIVCANGEGSREKKRMRGGGNI